jgi:spoIIIJ-associated protein
MSLKILEIEDKSIDDAIEKACRDFGVAREKLNIEIISDSTGGFLGMLSKKAKIRASLLSLDMDFTLTDNPEPKTAPRIKIEPRNGTLAVADNLQVIEAEGSPPKRDSQRLAESIRHPEETSRFPRRDKPESGQAETANVLNSVSSEAIASKARELLAGILNRMSFECEVRVNETPEKIILSIEGDDSGLLIGRRGQNLDALQYILNKAINRSSGNKMITVDSETYRKRREESLLELAQRIREKVKNTQKPVSLGHMNAHDRRIIHMALQEDETLITKSRGEGDYRKIMVLPARKANNNTKAKSRD